MSFLVGTWILLDHTGSFDEFLSYYGYNWLSRKAAAVANVDVTFSGNVDGSITRKIESTFLTGEETYHLDGKPHKTPNDLIKAHKISDNSKLTLNSSITMGFVNWTEDLQVIDDILFQTRYWRSNTESCELMRCCSRFKRRT